jgi:hypothetical protein
MLAGADITVGPIFQAVPRNSNRPGWNDRQGGIMVCTVTPSVW